MKIDLNTQSPSPVRPTGETVLHGIAASPGIAIGMALLTGNLPEPALFTGINTVTLSDAEAEAETNRFQEAIRQTRQEILDLRRQVGESLDAVNASIFDAHLLIVDDRMLMKEVLENIRKKKISAEIVFSQTIQRYIQAISAVEDQYLKERAADVSDVAARIMGHLSGNIRPLLDHLPGQRIIISRDLAPSDTVMLDRENVQAFATETGSRISHSAILARSMKIPAVVGIGDLTQSVRNGDLIVVDGNEGTVIINPTQETLESCAAKAESDEKFNHALLRENQLRPETADGFQLELAANLDDAEAVGDVDRYGAAGVGLFRTEYLFIHADTAPDEEKQFSIYRNAAEALHGKPLVIRTLDIGGDKIAGILHLPREANPFLGLRSVRLCLAHPELLVPQIRAILRASAFGNVKMMFPMITCEDELDKLKLVTEQVKQDLRNEKIAFDESMETGIMIETPAAAMMAEFFAEKCDFFSIGTNDLVQYTMAVDRGNEKVADLYRPLHPAILRLIRNTARAARKNRIWVSVCGEMASDPRFIPLLAGLGIQELSMSPVSIGIARRVIRRMRLADARELAEQALQCRSHLEVLEKSDAFLKKLDPLPESV